ncbi:hypothetical protein HPB50_006974 [Hyalomma asiaticum]|uniref:Uncharacterized protein n=1 Tax=Hyalomma asiaticum TaxID=266040 RepID=A0ACB7TDM7_HYAAI|nr:hypothetical protein HPB50_006974 [Hyalomma asiaticum]
MRKRIVSTVRHGEQGVRSYPMIHYMKHLFAAGFLPDKLDYRMASRSAGQTGDGTGDRVRLAEHGFAGRGYAISSMAAASRKIRVDILCNTRRGSDKWMPPPTNPCGEGVPPLLPANNVPTDAPSLRELRRL